MSVLVVADSRGDGLQHILTSMNTAEKYRVLTYRGSGFELAALRAVPVIKSIKPDLVIIFVGICDLTTRNKVTRLTRIKHPAVADNVKTVIEAAKASYTLLHSLGSHQISFATLTGIDLADYNHPGRKSMSEQEYKAYCIHKIMHKDQKILNDSLLEINRQLTVINKHTATPTTWTGGVVHSYFKNTHHHHYNRLVDGCHPDEATKTKWAAQLVKSTNRILRPKL